MQQEIIALARQKATERGIDDALVCAVCEQESGWNPYAYRYEPLFFAKYVAPLYTQNKLSISEAYARAFSWGALQIMGQTARELGFANTFLSALCDPATGIEWGCRKLAHCLDLKHGDVEQALLAYNGGSNVNYPEQVLARKAKYEIPLQNNHDAVNSVANEEN